MLWLVITYEPQHKLGHLEVLKTLQMIFAVEF